MHTKLRSKWRVRGHFLDSHKDGYEVYLAWKRLWSTHGTTDASIRMFMTNSVLPFWVQCNECHKWRQWSKSSTPIPEFLKNYVCGTMPSGKVRLHFLNVVSSVWKLSFYIARTYMVHFTEIFWFFLANDLDIGDKHWTWLGLVTCFIYNILCKLI